MSRTEMPDEDFLAAEFALGTLAGGALRDAQWRYANEARFAAEVDAWSQTLAPLAAGTPSVEPPARLWQAIAELTAPRGGALAPARNLVSAVWRWLALASMATAAASLVALVVMTQPAERVAGQGFDAVVASQAGEPLVFVTLSQDGTQARITPLALPAPADHSIELWYIAPGAQPRSLGVVADGRTHALTLEEPLVAKAAQDAFALSVEPVGGSPSGLPTGPVIAQGVINAI